MSRWRPPAGSGRLDLEPHASPGDPEPVTSHPSRLGLEPQPADGDRARLPGEPIPPLSPRLPVVAGWSQPCPRLQAADPAEFTRAAGLRHRGLSTLSGEQAKHGERVRRRLDTGRNHLKTALRPRLRQPLSHEPQVGLGGNSHNDSLASAAPQLNHVMAAPAGPGTMPRRVWNPSTAGLAATSVEDHRCRRAA